MTYYIEGSVIIAEFLRSKLTDPKGRITFDQNYSQTIDGSTRVIDVNGSKKISHIANVQVDGTPLTKYKEWIYDYQYNNLVLKTAQSGTLTYDVYVGRNWIYHDRPRDDLTLESFPRVCAIPVSTAATVLGNDKAKIVTRYRFQVNTFAKQNDFMDADIGENQTISMSDQRLSNKINDDIYEVFDNYRDELYPLFSNYTLDTKKSVEPYESTLRAYNTRQEFTILQLEDKF